ncbi:hypothetical protein P7C70_g5078, partial [Phenoliferia sp. Uapishka_3]
MEKRHQNFHSDVLQINTQVPFQVIKFSAPLATSPPAPISEADRGILTLQTTLTNLESYILSIESRIAEQQALVLQYHAKKQMTLVKSHIINRKRLESLLNERAASRDKVQEVLMGIEKAVGSEETIAALSLGTTTLRTLISSSTLSLEHIEATTTALSDVLADANDIEEAINAGGVLLPSEQEDDLEKELAEMVEAAGAEERQKKDMEELEKRIKEREEKSDKVERERNDQVDKEGISSRVAEEGQRQSLPAQ